MRDNTYFNNIHTLILKLVVCVLLRVLGQVQGFRLTQHCFEYFYPVTATCFGLMTIFRWKYIHVYIHEDGHKTETCSGY
jgi:hypothetical protein